MSATYKYHGNHGKKKVDYFQFENITFLTYVNGPFQINSTEAVSQIN